MKGSWRAVASSILVWWQLPSSPSRSMVDQLVASSSSARAESLTTYSQWTMDDLVEPAQSRRGVVIRLRHARSCQIGQMATRSANLTRYPAALW